MTSTEHNETPSSPTTRMTTGGPGLHGHHDEAENDEDENPPPPPPPPRPPPLPLYLVPNPDKFLDRFASQASDFLRNAYLSEDRPLRHTAASSSPPITSPPSSPSSSSFLTTSLCEDVYFGVTAQLAVLNEYLVPLVECREVIDADDPFELSPVYVEENIRTDAVYSLLHAMYCKQLAYRDRLLFPSPGRSDGREGRGTDDLGGREDGDVCGEEEEEEGDENYDEQQEEEGWERCLAAANDFYRLMERTEEVFGGSTSLAGVLHGIHPHRQLSSPVPSTSPKSATGDVGVTCEDGDCVEGGEEGHRGIEASTATTSSSTPPAPAPAHAPTPELSGLLQLYATDAVCAARLVSLSFIRALERSSIVDDLFGSRWETTLTNNEVAMSIIRTAEDYLADVEACACNEFILRKATEAMIESTVAFYATCLVRKVDRIRRARRAKKKRAAAARRAVAAGKERAASAASAAATKLARGRDGGAASRPHPTAGGSPDAAAGGDGGGDHPRPFVDPEAAALRMGDDVYLMKSSFKGWAILTMPVLDGTIEREFLALEAACSCLRAAAGVVVADPSDDDDDSYVATASAVTGGGGVPADFVSTLHGRTGGDVAVTRRFICDLWYMAVPNEEEYRTLPRSVEDELRKCEDRGGQRRRRAAQQHPRDRVDHGITLESALAEAYGGESSEDKNVHRRSGLPGTGAGAGKENSFGRGGREPRVKLQATAREIRSFTSRKLSNVHVPKNVSKAKVKKTASSILRTCKRAGHFQKT